MKGHFIIPLQVYPFDLLVSVGEDFPELSKMLLQHSIKKEEHKLAEYPVNCAARAVMFSGNQSLIRLRKSPRSPQERGTLAHEIMHIVQFVLARIGIPLKVGVSCEAYTYLNGYLTTEIYKRLK